METIGALSISALAIIGLWQLMIYMNNQDQNLEEKLKYFSHSETFRSLLKKENIQTEGVTSDTKGRLKKIIGEIEHDEGVQSEIKESVEIEKKQKLWEKERNQRLNYFAFQNLEIIKGLKRLKLPTTKLEIETTILMVNSNLNADNIGSKIAELIENRIIEKNEKTGQYNLFFFTEIYHPYELDQNGGQKVVLSWRDFKKTV